jgi:POT family proton-dependent oligopeptide transporter
VFSGLALVVGSVGWFVAIQKPGDKGPTASIFLFMLFNAFFWIAFEQAGGSMNLFAEQNTDRELFGWEISATWFQSINAGFIILFAPVFAWLWVSLGKRNLNPTQPAKIAFGLILLSLGFIFMVFGARAASKGDLVSPIWLFMAYYFHTMGELCLSPTGLSYVTKAAPVRFVSLLMGIWFISSFIANLGAGLIGAKVEAIERGEIKLPWDFGGQADFFALFVIVPGGVGLLILLFTPLLKKLLRNQND